MEKITIFKDFINHKKASEIKPGTIKFYMSHCHHFELFLKDRYNLKAVEELTEDMAADYILWNKKNVSASTINKRINILLKNLLRFYKLDSKFKQVMSFKKMTELGLSYEPVDKKVLIDILNYLETIRVEVYNGLMRKTAVILLAYTGVRLNELVTIEINNIDLEKRTILLTTTKSGRARLAFIHDDAIPIIKMAIDDAVKKKRKLLLWNNSSNKPMTTRAVTYFLDKIKKDLDLERLHPHMFRHFFASNLLQNGVDLKVTMDLMGHTNLSTTQKYLHSSAEYRKNSYLSKFKV